MATETISAIERRFLIPIRGLGGKKTDLQMDDTNIKIVNSLMSNPNRRSKDLAKELGIPMSTMQRRRTLLERTILIKKYSVDVRELGWRTADLFIFAARGFSESVAKALLSHPNVIATSIRVGDPEINVAAEVYYKDTGELHSLLEQTRAMNHVKSVEWSEVVHTMDKSTKVMLDKVFQ